MNPGLVYIIGIIVGLFLGCLVQIKITITRKDKCTESGGINDHDPIEGMGGRNSL